ncbi:MAG: hypothetical protein D6715_02720 [Calditrichaeota bacterium]|nr:MAG: hypothetical protein D6715_02720 [Calditrichota bacterium]
MWRNFLAVIVGMFVGALTVGLVEILGNFVFPLPRDVDLSTPEAISQAMASIPLGAMLFVLLAWAMGSLVGGFLAAWLAASHHSTMALAVGGILMIGGITTLVQIPHPLWFSVIGLLLFLPAAYLGGKLALHLNPKSH